MESHFSKSTFPDNPFKISAIETDAVKRHIYHQVICYKLNVIGTFVIWSQILTSTHDSKVDERINLGNLARHQVFNF